MRRVWLKGHDNIAKRLLVHTAGFNLAILLRKTIGTGTPQGAGAFKVAFFLAISALRMSCSSLRLDQRLTTVKKWFLAGAVKSSRNRRCRFQNSPLSSGC
jgi:hypothetical protein